MEPADLATLAAAHLDTSTLMIEVAAGYRMRAIEAGFSTQAAEMMAIEFHHCLLAQAMDDTQ